MAEQKQGDQLEPTYNNSVRIRDVALRTCQKRWTIGRSGKKGSGISVLVVRQNEMMSVGNFQNNGKIWISCIDKALLFVGKNTVQAKQRLDKCYSDSVPSETMVKRGYADFKRGRTETNDAERSGRLNSAVVPENSVNWICVSSQRNWRYQKAFCMNIYQWESLFKVGAAFAHRQSKTTTRRRCLQLFQHNKKEFFA